MITSFIFLAAQIAAVPPPIAQQTADCVQPVYATDRLVCDDATLHGLDGTLKHVLATMPTGVPAGLWIEPQEAWFARSRLCAFQTRHGACVEAAYRERISVLSVLNRGPVEVRIQCRLASGRQVEAVTSEGAFLIVDDGVTLGVALVAKAAWTPFLRVIASRGGINIVALSGQSVATCARQL